MTPSLQQELGKKKPFDAPEQEAYLNLLRTVAVYGADFERLFKSFGLSESTYNVLRILRGNGSIAGARGVTCGLIGEQLVARVPDVTRLLDRLESSGLIERARTNEDRRVVLITITPAGLELLANLDPPTRELHVRQLGHLSRKDLAELNRLLVKARTPE